MANRTEREHDDPRIAKIEESKVYALLHDGLLVYIGETTSSLQCRRNKHFYRAAPDADLRVHQYLGGIDDLREDIEIRELDGYETEKEAIEELGGSTLNGDDPVGEAFYRGHDWTSEELNVVEELPILDAAEKLGVCKTEVMDAARQLGCLNAEKSEHLSDAAVREVWRQYHENEDATYAEVAERFDRSQDVVGAIIRRQTYTDVDLPSPSSKG